MPIFKQSYSDKDIMRVTMNQNLLNLRKKSSGSVMKHIIDLHSKNFDHSNCDHDHDGPLLKTAKTSKKSLSGKKFSEISE